MVFRTVVLSIIFEQKFILNSSKPSKRTIYYFLDKIGLSGILICMIDLIQQFFRLFCRLGIHLRSVKTDSFPGPYSVLYEMRCKDCGCRYEKEEHFE